MSSEPSEQGTSGTDPRSFVTSQPGAGGVGQKRSAESANLKETKEDAETRHSLAGLISSLSSFPDLQQAQGSARSSSEANRPPFYLPPFSAESPSLSRLEQNSFGSLNSFMTSGDGLGSRLDPFASGNLTDSPKRSRTGLSDRSSTLLEPDKLSVSSFDSYLNFLRSSSQSIPSVVQSTLLRLEEQESQPNLSLPITGITRGPGPAAMPASAEPGPYTGNSLLAPKQASSSYPSSYRNTSESSDSSRESSRLGSSGSVNAVPRNTLLGSRTVAEPTNSISASSSSVHGSTSDDSKSLTTSQSAALRASAEAVLDPSAPTDAQEQVHVVGSAMQPPSQGGAFASQGAGVFVDITSVLHLTQSEAARRVGIPTSTLSKRWAEAVPDRKWPHRTVIKLDKAINAALARIPSTPPTGKSVKRKSVTVKKAEEKLARLLEERALVLTPVYIRIARPDQLNCEEERRKEASAET